jgi:hypothetical protein
MNMPVPAPHSPEERQLEQLQAKVTEGEIARARLMDLAFELWKGGMKQREIAARLNRADTRAGGEGITVDATQKMLSRLRRSREETLLSQAS